MQEYMDLEGQGWVGKTSPEKPWNSPSSLINSRRVRSLRHIGYLLSPSLSNGAFDQAEFNLIQLKMGWVYVEYFVGYRVY